MVEANEEEEEAAYFAAVNQVHRLPLVLLDHPAFLVSRLLKKLAKAPSLAVAVLLVGVAFCKSRQMSSV